MSWDPSHITYDHRLIDNAKTAIVVELAEY